MRVAREAGGSGRDGSSRQRVVIVGGGSAGWLAAAYLSRVRPDLRITLVESPQVRPVGVGESTNSITRIFNRILGLDEADFLRACGGSYKAAIRFSDFRARGERFYHPFGRPRFDNRFVPGAAAAFVSSALCDQNRFCRQQVGTYGYQVDAASYGRRLRRYAQQRGVERIARTLPPAEVGEDRRIRSIGGIRGDLFIDCTGFGALLLGESLAEPFLSLERSLLNDRAVVMDLPYQDPERECLPFTDCTALSAGWVWDIPLWKRRSAGYVYSSRFLGESGAEAELRDHLGAARVADLSVRHLRLRVGRHRRPWVGNCVALGLSAGFIEPLESTGLALLQANLILLANLLDDPESYVRKANRLFDSTVDFILAHYLLSRRRDSRYWRHVTGEVRPTASLATVLEQARRGDYGPIEDDPDAFYSATSWNSVLSGMGLFGAAEVPPQRPVEIPEAPNHYAVLGELHGGVS